MTDLQKVMMKLDTILDKQKEGLRLLKHLVSTNGTTDIQEFEIERMTTVEDMEKLEIKLQEEYSKSMVCFINSFPNFV